MDRYVGGVIQAGVGISTSLDPREAAREAAERALARCGGGGPGLALVAVTAAHGRGIPEAVSEARSVLGPSPMVGGSVEGVVAPGVEVTDWPAVLVLALSGAPACPFFLPDLARDGLWDGAASRLAGEVAARIGGDFAESDLVVMLADPHGLDARELAAAAGGLRPATVLGGGAAAAARGSAWLWHQGDVASTGVVGFVLRGAHTGIAIAPAGRAITKPMRVTRARGNWVLGLDARPALQVHDEIARRGPGDPRPEAGASLLVGLLPPDGDEMAPLIVRNVVGFDRARQAFAVPEPMASGQRLAFVVLDADAARGDLPRRLDALGRQAKGGHGRLAFGLYFNCRARGAALFGEAGVEAGYLANVFADLPLAGLVGPFQLAPLAAGACPALLGYAGALALVGDAGPMGAERSDDEPLSPRSVRS